MTDRICRLALSHVVLPLPKPVSDAKVLTGRQKPLTETVLLFVEVSTSDGLQGMGFSYSKRAGGPAQYTHLREIAEVALGQDPSDIDRIYQSLLWAGASVGRSGVATQAIAALDVAFTHLVEYTTLSQPGTADDPDPPAAEKIAYEWMVDGSPPVVRLTRTDDELNPKRPHELLDPATDPLLAAGSGAAMPLVLN